MKRKIIAAAAALAATAGLGIVSAPAANAYAYWKGGYFYGDTSYARNVPGVYAKIVGRRDVARQMYYMKITLYDTKTDGNRAAVRIRGWDKQTGKYVTSGSLVMNSGASGYAVGNFSFGTSVVDTLIVQDCIFGKTCGSNSIAVFRRYG